MLLHVLHETAYDYSPMVRTAQHMAHLKPVATAYQEVLSHRLTVAPRPAQQTESLEENWAAGNLTSLEGLGNYGGAAIDALQIGGAGLVGALGGIGGGLADAGGAVVDFLNPFD